ncbi:MAG: Gfo/Idh/MocA family oxidoreductase [candidate division KSB1 bacterium]|nr:Gfo/Idh/MocA family oxidoreductase [candidate division KSB1 bacterium]
MNRREFLKISSVLTTGSVLGATGLSAKSYSHILGANDRIHFAVVGVRSRGQAHAEAVKYCDNAIVTHICDVDKRYEAEFSAKIVSLFGRKPKAIKDIRKLVEEKDIDVVTIATPEHWHAHMSIMALQNGKHVYVEKPCSHNPREGELLVAAQQKYGRLVQMGNQQRSSALTQGIIQRIKDGLIGTPYFGKAWYSNMRDSIGVGKIVPVPDYLDWELWQGPAPRRDYRDNVHPYNWHWFWHWGTGETLNNGTHEVDLCRWAMGVDYPNRITAGGGRYHFKDDWEFYDTLSTNFEYNDMLITWEGKSCNALPYFDRGRGCIIHGTKGSVLIDRTSFTVFDLSGKIVEEFDASKAAATSDLVSMDTMTVDHFKNLTNAIRNGEKLNSPIVEGNIAVTMLQLSNIAWKLGRALNLDPKTGHILGDEQAMGMWGREYEPGWQLRV